MPFVLLKYTIHPWRLLPSAARMPAVVLLDTTQLITALVTTLMPLALSDTSHPWITELLSALIPAWAAFATEQLRTVTLEPASMPCSVVFFTVQSAMIDPAPARSPLRQPVTLQCSIFPWVPIQTPSALPSEMVRSSMWTWATEPANTPLRPLA